MSEEMDLSGHKRHKKHKKKHKRRHNDEDDAPRKPAIKLKIKIGQETLGEKSVTKTEVISGNHSDHGVADHSPDEDSEAEAEADEGAEENEESVRADVPPTADSDDEQAWMAALEAGELDENGALKTKKEKEKTLTKRQKALAESKVKDPNDIIYAWYPTLSPDQLQRRQQRAKKRRQMAHDKKEKDKKTTVDRLLKKHEAKVKSVKARLAKQRKNIPRVRYWQTRTSVSISYPDTVPTSIPTLKAPVIPEKVLCAVDGCRNQKKYSCSKTHKPLCSLGCYKKNLASIVQYVPTTVAVS